MEIDSAKFIEVVSENKVIPVFNHDDPQVALDVLRACYEGGIRSFEFTNRSTKAAAVFENLMNKRSEFPELLLGVGSLVDVATTQIFQSLGADFFVSPIIDTDMAAYCSENNLVWVPGCGTLTEIVTAKRLGASLMKVFPADVLGPKFVKGVLGPCPELKLMPTGGVLPTKPNLEEWFTAGVTCVGMGSQLITKQLIENKEYDQLKRKVQNMMEYLEAM